MKILDQVKDVVTGATVFGQPYEKNGVTVIPATRVSGGGGGGEGSDQAGGAGVGLDARPAGAFVIKGDDVSWIPAIDINRVIFMGQVVLLVAILSWRSVARLRARRP
ncbi:MAG TPA: sporulation protein [Candidatus Dormibacteraeota bacterium]|jgi:uncharacterized spore protein YtfJ|nr:sporulation protein [Candidatus Dormibacteraeota bacterium]